MYLYDLLTCLSASYENLWKSDKSRNFFPLIKKKKPKDTYPSHFTTAEILWLPPPKSMYEPLWVCWHIKSNEPLFNKITLKYMLAFQVVTIWCFLSNMSVASAWEHTQNLFSGDEISPSYLRLFFPKSICCHALFIIFGLNDFGLFSKLQTILKSPSLRKSRVLVSATQGVIQEPAISAWPGSLLEKQNARPHPRSAELVFAF